MPVPIDRALHDSAATAAAKARHAQHLPRYLASAALAGAYVGVAVVLVLSVAAPLVAAAAPAARLVQGLVFGVALALVVFAGAELVTGNIMTMLHGVALRRVGGRNVLGVVAASLAGNLAGSVVFSAVVHASGALAAGTAPGQRPATGDLLAGMLATKQAATGPQLFWRAVLANMLVCLGLWMAGRATGDAAKLAVLSWALLAFVASGFEHSIANMTLFSLGALAGVAEWQALWWNLAWTVPGNLVGGGLLVGVGYAWIGGARRAPEPAPAEVTPVGAAGGR